MIGPYNTGSKEEKTIEATMEDDKEYQVCTNFKYLLDTTVAKTSKQSCQLNPNST